VQLNGEKREAAEDACCREFKLSQGVGLYEARDECCIALEKTRNPGVSEFCAREICHFRLLAEELRESHDQWVEATLVSALAEDCAGGKCGVLGEVVSASDGQLGTAMENNAVSGAEPSDRVNVFYEFMFPPLAFDALLTRDTAQAAAEQESIPYPEVIIVRSFFFESYFKDCTVNAPCKLQEGILFLNIRTKYQILFRGLLASARAPDVVAEIAMQEASMQAWLDELPPYEPHVPQFAVPEYRPTPASVPLPSAIDHLNARQATRRDAEGPAREAESGPAVGSPRGPQCQSLPGLACYGAPGARRSTRRRGTCRPTSLYRPEERAYERPPWRYDLDEWMGPAPPLEPSPSPSRRVVPGAARRGVRRAARAVLTFVRTSFRRVRRIRRVEGQLHAGAAPQRQPTRAPDRPALRRALPPTPATSARARGRRAASPSGLAARCLRAWR
jgi:hypothetical protein